MADRKVDIAIIGTGTAGMTAYKAARDHTENVVTIEGDVYGTTCARVGCMPSKLLIAAAQYSHSIDRASEFGIEVRDKRVDGGRVMQRLRDERDRFVRLVRESVLDWPEEHRLQGRARFIGPHEIEVGDDCVVHAERVVIATGASPQIPEPWRELGDRLLSSDDIFYWDDLPESIAVVGTGPIGLEISQALVKLGVKTTLLGMGNRFGGLSDDRLNEVMADILAEGDLEVYGDARVEAVRRCAGGIELEFGGQGGEGSVRADYLLAATGRSPNLSALNLEAAGIKLDADGMPPFDANSCQISDSHLFMAGDVNDVRPLLHEAADDGKIAGDNAARYPDVRARQRRAPLSIVFSEPQIMVAGRSHASLTESDIEFAVAEASFENQGRSRVMGVNQGMLRVYGEQGSGKFLGAEMLGPSAEHIGHLLAWAVNHELSVTEILDGPFYHPVVEEGVRTALKRLNSELDMGPPPIDPCLDCGPGT